MLQQWKQNTVQGHSEAVERTITGKNNIWEEAGWSRGTHDKGDNVSNYIP